jgi:hypothetical protein
MDAKRRSRTKMKALAVATCTPLVASVLGAQPAYAGPSGSSTQTLNFTKTGGAAVRCTVKLTAENAPHNNVANLGWGAVDITPGSGNVARDCALAGGHSVAYLCGYWDTPGPPGGSGEACSYFSGTVSHFESAFGPLKGGGYFELFSEGTFSQCAAGSCAFSLEKTAPTK